MCSSAAAPIANELVEEFGVSPVQSRLPVAMFLFGMSIGPVILTPLAEVSDLTWCDVPYFSLLITGFRSEESHNDMFACHLRVFCFPFLSGHCVLPISFV